MKFLLFPYYWCKFFLIYLLGSFTILLLTSCINTAIPDYPSQLPPLVDADETIETCPDIEGQYMDEGFVYSLEGENLGPISLTNLLHYTQMSTYTVEVIGPQDNEIQINSWKDGVPVATWNQKKLTGFSDEAVANSYLCEKGYVRLGRTYVSGMSDLGPFELGVFLWLRKAVDGSLIVLNKSHGGTLVFFVVPVPEETDFTFWCRFPPVP